MKLNKKQKRTATIASMAALLAVVLGMGGQTFAKYIETNSISATQATVAKWGFVVTANATSLWGTEYDGTPATVAASKDGNGVVLSADTENVLAPGTQGYAIFGVTGSAEVDATITTNLGEEWKEVTLTKTSDSSKYQPLVWTLEVADASNNYQEVTISDTVVNGRVDLSEIYNYLKTDLNRSVNSGTNVYKLYKLSWAWPFTTGDVNDDYDTILGHIANEETVDGYTAQLVTNIAFDCTVSQSSAEVA